MVPSTCYYERKHLLLLLWLDCAVLSFLLILPETKLLSHVRWPPHTCSYNYFCRMWRSDCSTRRKKKLETIHIDDDDDDGDDDEDSDISYNYYYNTDNIDNNNNDNNVYF